ncbi:MAG: VOC family protein [Candidatus Thiodiazotropha sp.]
MKVKRIVSNIAASNPDDAKIIYETIFGLDLVMDHGWIKIYSSGEEMTTQISVASEGGSGTAVPDLSIEVDDLDAVLRKAIAENIQIEYGPASEPWGVRRFYLRDPFGNLINVLQHE